MLFSGVLPEVESATLPDASFLQHLDGEKSRYLETDQGPVIEWQSGIKLKYEDFKARGKGSPGFAVATTASAFGYSITNENGNISGSIFVRFYCNDSWWNPEYILDDVLKHEQLHFDICELFGRKLFKEVLDLGNKGRLNQKTIQQVQTKFEKQYDDYQDLYDKQTDHSTNGKEQRRWNQKVKQALDDYAEYANYHDF